MNDQTSIMKELEEIQQAGLAALDAVQNENELQAWRIAHLGRSAPVMQIFSRLGSVPKDLRPLVGQQANQVKLALEAAQETCSAQIHAKELERKLQTERLDVTLPGRQPALGRMHPSTQILNEICAIFQEMGFQIYRSPEVETDEMNFELLNIPAHHPARDMWNTFHTTREGLLLRTHTSPGQIRVMRERCPEPIRVILPGKCYRYEQVTARHESMFYQVEGLAVGERLTMGDLKGTLISFSRQMFGPERKVRFRASYFPFTEPSAEVDIDCVLCGGKGCRVCKNSGWLEILGCGMVHPNVLRNGGYDPAHYTGFAFGMGPERIAMLKYGIDDIRYFFANDLRFLQQFV